MNERRWTIEAASSRVAYSDDLWLDYDDIPALATVPDSERQEAFAALVQCVRDADTLHKAREIARQATSGPMFGTHDPRISGIYRLMELLTEDADGPLVAGDPHHNPKD